MTLDSHIHARILIACKDQPGIVAKISTTLFSLGANITESAQHTTNPLEGTFFMRIAFYIPRIESVKEVIQDAFAPLIKQFSMQFQLFLEEERKRFAIFVSREDHCLLELLWRQRSGEIQADISMIVSNHPNHEQIAQQMNVPYYYIPVTPEKKLQSERQQLQLLVGKVDFIVLARYMQILSPQMVEQFPRRMINIHHSFLPAFVGAKPYERAYERGVKIIGATAHYVTADLDAGPIIEQDVLRIDHGYSVKEMKAVGRQIERTVLARAVRWHVEDRILVHDNKTIVFT
ncbi:formyltetrahydrofolate deformylase [Sulfoacidibacillus thermotolerans]|uniref:Formyltetrahydrofolate deformylase n=1 Tax=Sulfoacidibacillus thermotolerans TaxID=1765684 RepID=A0A2U3DBR5_SULT2|nr:formyltetrahydrofolate deformylase [Sulfoacidibacillus thermotolerans]